MWFRMIVNKLKAQETKSVHGPVEMFLVYCQLDGTVQKRK